MTNMKRLILSLAFAFAAVAVQPWPATAKITSNGANPNGASVSGAGDSGIARGLEIVEIELPQAVIDYVTKE